MIKPENNATMVGIEVTDAGDEKAVKLVINGSREGIAVAAVRLLSSLTVALSRQGSTIEQLMHLRVLYETAADEIRQKK